MEFSMKKAVLKESSEGQIYWSTRVNNRNISTEVDTAAVSVVSRDFAKTVNIPSIFVESVKLKGVGNDQCLESKLARNVKIQIGDTTIFWDVYIAPIEILLFSA